MKITVLIVLVCGMLTMHVNANEQDNGFWFPNESLNNTTEDEPVVSQETVDDDNETDCVYDNDTGAISIDHEVNTTT